MPTRGGDLDGAPSGGLPHHVAQVGDRRSRRQRSADVPGQRRPAGEVVHQLGQRRRREHLDALHQRCLVGVGGRYHDLPVPGAGRGQDGRQHAPDAAHRAVEPELAEEHQPVDRLLRHRPRGGQDGGRQREVEATPLLRHRRRRQPDGDPPLREGAPALTTAARTRSIDCRTTASGSPTRITWGNPFAMSTSTSTMAPWTPGKAHRPGAGEGHAKAARRWVTSAGRPGRTRTPTTSKRSSGVLVVRGEPPLRERAQPPLLGRGDRLDGGTEADAPAGLHLAEDEGVPVAGDDVELTLPAAPVAVEHAQPGIGEIGGGGALPKLPR